MLEALAAIFLEELSYSGSLHVKHVRISPTYKDRVIEFLLENNKIVITEGNVIFLTSPDCLE